ncbi:hypothetical protein BC938DRAFT_478914 [Jimgerdemannia flammicorona]|uniref:SAM domain-containing protein n=1 Tax=Jimgerdemannia flammicorona TaxID=994334 RepID=A0A433QY36_9FUNG|nr:hypothetical protein BC938DRAFT_478914 [Jimgerdemannia flammicorona]
MDHIEILREILNNDGGVVDFYRRIILPKEDAVLSLRKNLELIQDDDEEDLADKARDLLKVLDDQLESHSVKHFWDTVPNTSSGSDLSTILQMPGNSDTLVIPPYLQTIPIEKWVVDDVNKFLKENQKKYDLSSKNLKAFAVQEISGMDLRMLTRKELQHWKLPGGPAKRIIGMFQDLRTLMELLSSSVILIVKLTTFFSDVCVSHHIHQSHHKVR